MTHQKTRNGKPNSSSGNGKGVNRLFFSSFINHAFTLILVLYITTALQQRLYNLTWGQLKTPKKSFFFYSMWKKTRRFQILLKACYGFWSDVFKDHIWPQCLAAHMLLPWSKSMYILGKTRLQGVSQHVDETVFWCSVIQYQKNLNLYSRHVLYPLRTKKNKMSNEFRFRWKLLLLDWNWALWRAAVVSEAFTQWKCHLSHALIVCQCSVHQLCVTLWACALASVMPL